MKRVLTVLFALFLFLFQAATNAQSPNLELKKATYHPIQYYISLPSHWSVSKTWPIVVVLEAAEKEFKKNAERFMAARKDMPFIIVAPFITTNGQQGLRDNTVYPYSVAVWDTIDKITNCRFDMEGLQQIISDVRANYSGSGKIFITGFEAGAHLLWAIVFQHPELLYAAAPVAENYRSRCMQTNSFSNDASRIQLPIRNFTGENDKGFGVNGTYYNQYLEAKNLAISHGYKNITETEVKGKDHVPLPENVMEYFNTVWETVRR